MGVGVGVSCVGCGDVLGVGEAGGEGEVAGGLFGLDGEMLTSGNGCGTSPVVMPATSEYPRLSQKPR